MNRSALFFAAILLLFSALPTHGQDYWEGTPVQLQWDRSTLKSIWEARIRFFLDRGVIPLIDLESTLKRADGEIYLQDALPVMDELGVALIAFDTDQAEQTDPPQTGYRWNYYIHRVVNDNPDRFILATNGGTSKNWAEQKSPDNSVNSYVEQLERHVRSADYPTMGEIEFRHYLSKIQCQEGKIDRLVDVPLDSANGHRVFSVSQETNVPLLVHLEMEDRIIPVLESMLQNYPGTKLVVAHFGQIRNPEAQTLFGPELVHGLLTTYPNLYFDLATGQPGRTYNCPVQGFPEGKILDTVIWQDDGSGGQLGTLKPEYQAVLTEFSDRFVVGFDYGGGRAPLADFLRSNAETARLIMRDLPEGAQHDIGYRNALFLLNGRIVAVDIKPGSSPNSINLGSGGTVPVAILSSQSFDARTVDPTTVTLASAPVKLKGKGTPMASFQDVNGDGLLDLVVHVSTETLQLSDTDTAAVLEGKTFAGTPVKGADLIRVVP